jgi:ADP-ribose pyrophosphatase YjhB (NUDIX family)
VIEANPTEIRPGVADVIYDDVDRMLLHRRRFGDRWAPVSGHVEPGELIIEALHRKVREATGQSVEAERLVSLNSDPAFQIVACPDGGRVQFVTTLFVCWVAGDPLRGSDEGAE